MRYFVGVDIGTTCTKTVLFDEAGTIAAAHEKGYPSMQPRDGWMEQYAEDWWEAAAEGLRAVAGEGRHEAIAGIGVTGQFQTLVMLDQDANVIRPPILWCDRREEEERKEIGERIGLPRLTEITANPTIVGSTAAKLMWVRENEPALYETCAKVMLPNDYIRYRLTSEYATDVTNGSSMHLLDVRTRHWSEEILSELEIDRSLLPPVYESASIVGYVTKRAAELTGLKAGTPVAAAAGDTLAAAIGTGATGNGIAYLSLGTSGMIAGNTDALIADPAGSVSIYCAAETGKWSYITCLPAAGLCLQWLRDTCCQDLHGANAYALMDRLAAQSPAGAQKLFFLPYLMGDRTPHMDPKARGAFLGLSPSHQQSDMIRAVMEGVAFSQRDCVDTLRELGIAISDLVICGGGAKSELWRKIIADILESPVSTLRNEHGCALGAAILAAVGSKEYSSVDEAIRAMVHRNTVVAQDPANASIYRTLHAAYQKAYQNLSEWYQELAHV